MTQCRSQYLLITGGLYRASLLLALFYATSASPSSDNTSNANSTVGSNKPEGHGGMPETSMGLLALSQLHFKADTPFQAPVAYIPGVPEIFR